MLARVRWFYPALALYALIILIMIPKWTVDDAYITFRYAHNLVEHGQLTWNIGEPPVEGYTGIVLPLLIALALILDLDPILVSQGIGVISLAAAYGLLYLVLRELNIRSGVRKFILLLYVSSPFVYIHTLGGLDTSLFSAALLASLYGSMVVVRRQKYLPALLILFLLTSLIRPEGIVLAGVLIAALGWMLPNRRSFVLHVAIWFVLLGALYLAWKLHYYEYLLPNTYYAKRYNELFNPESLDMLWSFIDKTVLYPVLLAGVLVLIDPIHAWRSIRYSPALGLTGAAGLFVVGVTLQYLHSDLVMNYSHRFFMPLLPFLLIFIGLLVDRGVDNIIRYRRRRLRLFAAALFVLLIVPLPLLRYPLMVVGQYRFARDMRGMMAHEHIAVGKDAKTYVPPSEWLVAYMDAGAVSYYSELNVADFGKLSDLYLAHHTLSDQALLDYFFSFNAGAIVMSSHAWDRQDYHDSEAITLDPRFDQYVLVERYRFPGYDGYYQFLYLRADLVR